MRRPLVLGYVIDNSLLYTGLILITGNEGSVK